MIVCCFPGHIFPRRAYSYYIIGQEEATTTSDTSTATLLYPATSLRALQLY